DVILSHYDDAEASLLEFMRARAGDPDIAMDPELAGSERESGHRNVAMANFLRSFDNLNNDVDEVLDLYYLQCSLGMHCVDLARSVRSVAADGRCGPAGEPVARAEHATRIYARRMTAGTYHAAADSAFYGGLPAKSGVSGGIGPVVPIVMGLCVWY